MQDNHKITKQLAEQNQSQKENQIENEVISTSISEVKLSPNCTIVEKQYYKGCDHLIKVIKEIPEGWTNWNEEQIRNQYPDWTIESFSNNQVIVSQEKEGICPQHYVIREHDGVLGIYILDESGQETFQKDTEIATRYLPEEDLETLKKGIKAIGDDQLHTVLEDFE